MNWFWIIGFVFSTLMLFLFTYYTFLISMLPPYKSTKKIQEPSSIRQLYLMIPCVNEEKVIGSTLACITRLMPPDTIVYVIDDASTDSTPEIVHSYPGVRLFQRVKPDAQRGKGEALNACFQEIQRDAKQQGLNPTEVIVGIFDADAWIDERYFSEVLQYFVDGRVGQVQSRVRMIQTSTFLQKMQEHEFMLPITVIQNVREYTGSVCMGGNGQYARLSALLKLGERPWGTCLLEDFEISLRLFLVGEESRFARGAEVRQQALKSVKRFIRQRSRWVQGNIQAWAYFGDIVKSQIPLLQKVDLIYFLVQSWINLFGVFLQVGLTLFFFFNYLPLLVDPSVLSSINIGREIANLCILILISYLPALSLLTWRRRYCQQEQSLRNDLYCMLFSPVYNFLSFPSIIMAFWRQMTKKTGWLKTSRNV